MNANRTRWLLAALVLCAGRALLVAGDSAAQPFVRPAGIYDYLHVLPIGDKRVDIVVTLRRATPLFEDPPAPMVINAAPGTSVRFAVDPADVIGGGVTWMKNGSPVAVGTATTFALPAVTPGDSAYYGATLSILSRSVPAFECVLLRVEAPQRQRLLNLSTRAMLGPAQRFFICGLVVAPSPARPPESKTLLIRAVGPTLGQYGVPDPLAAPEIHIYNGAGVDLDTLPPAVVVLPVPDPNALAARVGAFPLPPNTKDVVRLLTLSADNYTVKVSSADAGSGSVLLEIYEIPD